MGSQKYHKSMEYIKRRTTILALVLIIVVLTVGSSACDRVSEIIRPATPQMQELRMEISMVSSHLTLTVMPFMPHHSDRQQRKI